PQSPSASIDHPSHLRPLDHCRPSPPLARISTSHPSALDAQNPSSSAHPCSVSILPSPRSKCHASRYRRYLWRRLFGVKCSEQFFQPVSSYGMMYQASIGIKYTAKKSSTSLS